MMISVAAMVGSFRRFALLGMLVLLLNCSSLYMVHADDAAMPVVPSSVRPASAPVPLPKKSIADYAIPDEVGTQVVCDDATQECVMPTSLPVGATYQVEFEYPIIGAYIVKLQVVSPSRAKLVVDGGYPIRDSLEYQLKPVGESEDANNNRVTFNVQLSDKMKGILDQFTVTLSEIRYDIAEDSPSVLVSILYMLTFPLKLTRAA
jgi:hypothetical protein